jgi:hypothetical protein
MSETTTPMDWGSKTCLMGKIGSGKTSALKTLLHPALKDILGFDLKVYAIFTEPSPLLVLREELPRIKWAYLPPAMGNWETLLDIGNKVNLLGNKQLLELGKVQAGSYNQFLQVIRQCHDFVDSEGKHHGPVDQFGPDCFLWMDSLTGLNKMAKKLVSGEKPILSLPDWGVSMDFLQSFVDALNCSLRCHFAMCAHIEYGEDDLENKVTKILISTLGRKLAPVLPATFADVVLTVRNLGAKFSWCTDHSTADLRNTYLPISADLHPSFIPLLSEWKRRTKTNGQ